MTVVEQIVKAHAEITGALYEVKGLKKHAARHDPALGEELDAIIRRLESAHAALCGDAEGKG